MRKTLVLFFCQWLFMIIVIAQTKSISGKVKDASGIAVAGATISVQGKAMAATNTSGDFTISIAGTVKSIRIAALGYETTDVPVNGNLSQITLTAANANDLSEVVITGYTSVAKKKFVGSVVNVSAAEIRKQTFGSFDQALQGAGAGISVIANSGQPGSNAVVRVRGNGSISGGNVPLYVLDGIEITAADFASLNQGDFDRVEVLKDATSTALYGSRGANGVIVISTKRGRSGQLQFSYDTQIGFSDLPKDRLITMNSKQKIDYELQRGNPYGWTTAEADSLRKVNFNWKDVLFHTGVTQQHMLSASGGSASSRFYASLSYMDQEGTVRTTGLKRYTARVNVDNTIKNWRFGVSLQAGYSKQVGTSETNTFLSTPLNATRWANPYERDIDPNTGEYQQFGGSGTLTSGQPNPAMELFLNKNNSIQVKTVATSYLEFHLPFLKGLTTRTNWGIDYTQNEASSFTSPKTSTGIARQGALTRTNSRNFRYTGTTSVNYKNRFGEHEIEAGLFTEVVKNDQRSFAFTGYGLTNGFANEAGITPGSAANPNFIPTVSGSGTQNGIQSYFALINYGYKDKYFVSLVGRRDGSSRFGINNRFANFGSVGITWVMNQEFFLQNVNFLNDLRLRASIGTNGNNLTQAGDYPIPVFARNSYAGTSAWVPSTAGNLDYRWETNRTINVGVDFALFKRRLSGTLEVYDRKTIDLFFARPIDPAISGFSNIPSNFGSLRNRGIEFTLKADVIRSKQFTWTLEGNLSYNQNRIIDLPRDSTITGNNILAKNKPINSFFLVQYAGVDPTNGNALYEKNDKTKTPVYSANDKRIYGTSDAPLFGAVTTRFQYKGFDLSAQLNFFLNRQMYNNDYQNVINPQYFFDNMSIDVLREWTKPGDITDVPRPSAGTLGGTAPANPYQQQTTRFLEDASFWRLRNVTLGYTFKNEMLTKAGFRSARIFIQGQNWWASTKFRGFDPEATGTSLVGAQFPALVQTTMGVSIGF